MHQKAEVIGDLDFGTPSLRGPGTPGVVGGGKRVQRVEVESFFTPFGKVVVVN